MGKKRSELDSLYRSISEKFDVGTFEEFSNKMQTPEDRKRFYEVVLDRGIDLGDYSEYERRLGGVQGVSAQGSAGTSETSGQPSGSSVEPSLGNQPAQVPVAPTPEQVGEAVTDFEAQQIANVGNQYADRYVPEDSTVVTPINTSAGPSVAVLGDDGEIFNVIPPVDVVTQIPFDVSMRNTFSNLKHQIEGIDDRLSLVTAETWEKLLGKELAKSWYDFNGRDIRQVKLDAYAELDRLESEMKQTASITGSLRAGDALGFLAASVNALSALGTTAIASISTGGVGLYTEMVGQSIYDFNKTRAEELGLTVEQLYDQGKAEFGVPATIGMLGGILEKVGFKGATRAFLAQLNSSATRKLVKAGLGANQEGVTEWLQTGLEAVNQMYAENPDASTFDVAEIFAKSLFSEEGLESYLMGAIGSASASGIGRATSHVVSRMVDRKRARDVENKMESIQVINQDLENTEMSPATATALESERDRLVSEVAEDISADAEQESQLSPEVRSEVEGLMGRLEELQSAIHDPNVSEETKSLLQSQAEQISSEIDSLISAEPESVDAQASEYSGKTVSELESEYEALGQDLQNGMITQEEFDSKSDDIYNEILSRKGEEEAERRLFEDRQARRQAEVDEAIRSFQENNPNVEVDLFEDTPDSVVRTFDRVERGLPTDPVALSETSDWLYAKYQEILAERDNPNRRHTIDQLNAIANQLGEDITTLENYKYEQQGEQQIQSEAEASVVADETNQGVEATQTTESEAEQVAEVEQATLEAAETSPVRDDISSDEALGQLTAEVSSEAPVEAVSDGGVVGDVEQEADPVSVEDVQSEREQSEVSLPVSERPVRITDDMPPKQPDNAKAKSLLRMLPRQDTAEMMGPANVEYRRDVIESITGKRPAKKDAGITNVRRAIADYLGIDLENTSGVNFSDMVRNWANSPDSSQTTTVSEVENKATQPTPTKEGEQVREQARVEEEGQTQEVADKAQQDTATEAQQPVAQEALPLMPDTQTVSMPVSKITTDESSFQNREGLDQSRVDDIVENFDEVKLDPIVVYNDDGKMVVLSGHHRLAAAQQMGMENIPAKIFKGTKEEAIEFARDSNTLSRAETATERAARYRDMRARGDSEATIKEKARIAHGPEATKVINLSHLSPGGKALDAINSFSKSGDTDTRNKVEAIGDWIGNVKSKHPDLSTRQENEMFDYLMEKYGTKRKSGSISSRAQFFDVANALIERAKSKGSFNEDTVLNLNNAAGKTGIELEYDRLLQEAKDAVQEARTALDNARKRAVSEGISSERMTSLLEPLENNLRNALADEQAVRQSKGLVQDAVKAQTSIFDIIQENETEISSTPSVEQRIDDAFKSEQTTDTETTGSTQGTKRAKPKTPKTLLKGIADRLSKTGLAKSVKIMTSEEIVADLTGRANNPDVRFQVSAWHGSPHVFDKFSASAIGTGEGAQAFGWGLYFTDLESIARNYADSLSEPTIYIDGVEFLYEGENRYNPIWQLGAELFRVNSKEDLLEEASIQAFRGDITQNQYQKIKDFASTFETLEKKKQRNLYKATLHKGKTPDQYTWLEWDKNITTEFNDRIRKQAKKEGLLTERTGKSDVISGVVSTGAHFITEGVNGEVVYDSLAKTFGSPKEASLFLLRAGIDGVKYPAESTSRRATSDTAKGFNYVVFDENAIEIEEHIQFQKGEDINGYVDADGNIVINSDTAGLDTPIHEFAHIWERTIETQNPFLHQRGMELIQSEEGKPYVDHVKKTQPSLTGQALYKEALAQAIGDRGARLIESQKNSPIKQWLKDAWDFIAKMVGLSEMTASQVSKLTLQEFADAVAVDLLSGKPFAKMPNGDVVVKTEATSEGNMDEADRFMAEFMERMRKRNGVSFQGNISSSLSPQDFRDLTTFFRHAKSKGLISGIADARALAVAMNIANVSQVDMAFKLSEFTGKGVTGFKKSEVSAETIANTKFDKISDSKYREIGRNLVESGVVNPTELVDDLIHNRRVPLPEEVAALQYYSTQLDNQRNEIRDLVRKGTKEQVDKFSYQGESGYNALSIKADALSQARFDLEVAMLQSAHLQSAAFRLRSVMSDKDFNIVTYLAEMKARGYVDPEVEKRLIELSAELESVRAKLREKMEEAEKKSDEIGFDNIKQEASKPEPKRRRVKPRKEVVEKVTQVLDSLDVTSFGLPGMNFQANGTIRFQVNPNTSVADSVQRAVAQMKASIAEGVNIGEAIETAIDAVSSEVGAENWDSVKFRSVVTNQLIQEEVSFKSRKPYVDSSGQLIVPGQYLKDLVRSGTDTIDGMVEAVNAEMGGSFSPYDIQNAISGYGRQAASKRSDLDRKISKARRIARLMSAVEDLQEKGTRVKTRKAASENDTRINELLDTIKKLEYDLEMTPEERSQYYTKRKNESRRKYLENYISEVEERIRNKDFEPVSHVNTYEKDQETLDLEQEAQRIRNEFKKEKYRHELETRSVSEKIRSIAYDIIFNILRGLTAGADASAVGVQGAIITAARPGYMAKTFIDTLGKTFSEAEYDAYFETLQSDPFFEMARKAKLNLQLPSFYQSVQEEQYKGQFPELIWNSFVSNPVGWAAGKITGKDTKMMREVLADKANPFTLGDRNYSLVLSQIRMDLFREFITNQINKQGLNTELDTKTIEQVAEMVNTLTMASKVPVFTGKLGNDILSATLFSARKLIATWKILGAWVPLLVGSNRNPQLLYDAYGKILLKGLGTMFAVSALPIATAGLLRSVGDDDEEEEDFYFDNKNFFNPIHSDFMKIRLGDTRISLFQGIDGNIIFLSRFASNHYMTSSSQGVKRLDGQQGRNTRGGLILDYMRNKLAPTPSLAVNALGDDRDKQEGVQRFRDSFMPMWASGIREQYKSTGNLPETMFLGAAGFFGLSFNNYGGAEFAKPNGTDNAKVLELYSKSGLGAYDPTPNTRTAFDGKRVSKVGGSEFKDKYLPAYQEYMTQVSLSLRHKISADKHWEHKEGVVDNWKREAYKYAEIKTTGVYSKDRFDRFSKNGTEYRLTESQYALKAGYIKEFMEGSGARKELRGVRANVRAKLRAEGAQSTATPEYTQMLIDLQLYNKANSYANERLYQDMRRRKIKLVTSADFTSDMNELPEE